MKLKVLKSRNTKEPPYKKSELTLLYSYYTTRELYFRVGNEWSEQSQVPSWAVTQY